MQQISGRLLEHQDQYVLVKHLRIPLSETAHIEPVTYNHWPYVSTPLEVADGARRFMFHPVCADCASCKYVTFGIRV